MKTINATHEGDDPYEEYRKEYTRLKYSLARIFRAAGRLGAR